MNEPRLKLYDQFKDALADYQVSEKGKRALKDLRLVLLMAASSTGRSLINQRLLKSGKYYYIVSDTTRPPQIRDGKLEQNGVQYYFRDEEDFLADLKKGDFLEAEIVHGQQVSGISIRELEKAHQSGKVAFTETDIAGVTNIKKVKSDTVAIFLLPPNFAEWQRRMVNRGGLTPGEIQRRLATAERFLKEAPTTGLFELVIADDPDRAAQVIENIVAGKPNPDQEKGELLARELLAELQEALHY